MRTNNIIVKTDSYKLGGHFNMYPDGTEYIHSYFEARKFAQFPETVFHGLQYLLEEYLAGPVVTQEKIDQAAEFALEHFSSEKYFNRKGWEYILKKYDGKLPVRIKAVAEGTVVPIDNILMNVENTDPKVPWLSNYLETLLTHVWYPSTVATLSRECKKMLKSFLDKTSDTPDAINFQLHDFGARGVSSNESGAVGGAAHLINFFGTDTDVALDHIADYYPTPGKRRYEGLGYSVAATEHSIMTALGRQGEEDVLDSLLLKYPKGILSVVSDSYDIYNFVEKLVCKKFKQDILNRDGVFVVRPDSITPIHPTPESEVLWIVQTLANHFGYTVNSKGYLVLHPKVRVIWGDGIDKDGIEKILKILDLHKFSTENLVFGMGGGLLQKINRDTQRFAFKSSAQCRNSQWYDIYKEPKDLSKASKRGKLALVKVDGIYKTVLEKSIDPKDNLLHTVFENGVITKAYTFAQVRENAKI